MGYDIIVGRDEADRKKFGDKGTVYLGKLFVKMGPTTSLSNNIYLDIAKTHVLMICGKRGSGKSYSASVIAEEMTRLPPDVKKNLTALFFDTLGVFWTMKYPNNRQEDLLKKWDLKPEGLDVKIFVPVGLYQKYLDAGIPADYPFAIRTSELNASDWAEVFDTKLTDSVGILIERTLAEMKEKKDIYSIQDIINELESDFKSSREVKDATINRFLSAASWGLFDTHGTTIDQLIQPGAVTILDTSAYTNVSGNWGIKALVIGIVCRKLLEERIVARKTEEMEDIQQEKNYFYEGKRLDKPLVWILLDEAHEFLKREGKTPATDALVQLLREGRQPGISLCLVTQQPGEIHKDVLTQSDIVLSHRLTSKVDIEALNSMMQSYLYENIQQYLNELPRLPGAAILLDDNSERIYPLSVHPKRSWHGGEAPSAVKLKKEITFGF